MGMLADMQKLWALSRECQALSTRIERLQPLKWLETDEARLEELAEEVTATRLEQMRLLRGRDVPGLIARLEAEGDAGWSARDAALVRAMKRLCAMVLPLGENDIRAMEKVTAASETAWFES